MHEAAFANAMLQRTVVIFKIPLRPYSLAHELWLISRNNPLAMGGDVDRRAIQQAVMICCHTHAEILRLDRDPLLRFKMKVWRWSTRREDVGLAAADFRNYMKEGSSEPETIEIPSEGQPQPPAGAPFLLRLLQFLMLKFHLTEEEALDYPKAAAIWHFCAHAESRGGLRIRNHLDLKADQFIARMDELVATGKTVDEAIRIVRAEEEACAQ